jgi:hypothetical protein
MKRLQHYTTVLGSYLMSCAAVPAPQPKIASEIFFQPPRFANSDVDLVHGIVSQVFSDAMGPVGSCFTMVSIVTGRPEEMVYLTCPGATEGPVVVGHLVASESIASKLHAEGAAAALHVQVAKTEANVRIDQGALFRQAWLGALESAEINTRFPMVREVWRDFYFSAHRPGRFRGSLGGFAQNPAPKTIAKKLIELAGLLANIADLDDHDASGREPLLMRAVVLSVEIADSAQ